MHTVQLLFTIFCALHTHFSDNFCKVLQTTHFSTQAHNINIYNRLSQKQIFGMLYAPLLARVRNLTRQCRLNLWGYVMAIVMNMSNYEIERTSETIVSDKPDLSNERRQMLAQLKPPAFCFIQNN